MRRVVATSGAERAHTDTGRDPAGRETQHLEPHPALAMQRSAGNSAVDGAKTVTVDVGVIINEGWKKILEARGYVPVATDADTSRVKTIRLE